MGEPTKKHPSTRHPPRGATLSVVIPSFNEVGTIEDVIRSVRSASYPASEIIVVDDASTDGTRELLEGVRGIDRLIVLDKNRGKGAAIRAGIAASSGDVIVIQDADLEYDPNDYGKMIEPILAGDAEVVFGSRFLGSGQHPSPSLRHRLANRALTYLSNAFSGLSLTDVETGLKMFRREAIQGIALQEERFGIEPEIAAKIARAKLKIKEVPVSYRGREYRDGKKIGWLDGVRALYCIVRYNIFR